MQFASARKVLPGAHFICGSGRCSSCIGKARLVSSDPATFGTFGHLVAVRVDLTVGKYAEEKVPAG